MQFDIVESGIRLRAYKTLKKMTYDSVSLESAHRAINNAVDEVLNLKRESEIKILQDEKENLLYYKKKFAEMQKLCLEMHEESTKVKTHVTELVHGLVEKLQKATSIKEYKKELPNKNTFVRKANKNAAIMEKEITPDGKNVYVKVTNLEGDFRKTIYNPTSGKPAQTFTNTNGKTVINYDSEGKFISFDK